MSLSPFTMQQSLTNDFMLHRNIVALNNCGVDLLAKRCYAQAVDVFERLLNLLAESPAFQTAELQLVAKAVSQHIAYPRPAQTNVDGFTALTLTEDGDLVDDRGESSCVDSSIGLSNIPQGATAPLYTRSTIALRMNGSSRESILRTPASQLMVVLCHNFALSCRCLLSTCRQRHPASECAVCCAALQRSKEAAYAVLQNLVWLRPVAHQRLHLVVVLHYLSALVIDTMLDLFDYKQPQLQLTPEVAEWQQRQCQLQKALTYLCVHPLYSSWRMGTQVNKASLEQTASAA